MNTINKSYYAYELMMRGYENGDISKGVDHPVNTLFRDGAVRLASSNDMAAWSDSSRAMELLFTMRACYHRWRQPNVDRRVNRIRLQKAAEELAQLELANPFVYETDSILDDPSTISLDAISEIENETYETISDTECAAHFFGILPTEE